MIIASGIKAEVNPSKNRVLKVIKFAAYNITRVKATSSPPLATFEAEEFFITTLLSECLKVTLQIFDLVNETFIEYIYDLA